jgi:NAD(P)-dependent dehydrogenase (short-subunit alcohol dehydrogenase family)
MRTLRDQIALVTGAGGAIGTAIVGGLARRGARVFAASLASDQSARDAVEKAIAGGANVTFVELDVASGEQVDRAIAQVREQSGRLDLLINNAGRFYAIGALWEMDPQVWLEDVTTNLFGTFLCCRAAIPLMSNGGGGGIINLVGGGFDRPNPGGTSYASSKAGIARLTDTLAAELTSEGMPIAIHGLMPGLVRSYMTELLSETSGGKKWLPHVAAGLRANEDIPATAVAETVLRLAEYAEDIPSGRIISWDDDPRELANDAEAIRADDLFQIRWRRPANSNPNINAPVGAK